MANGVRAVSKLVIIPFKEVNDKGKLKGLAAPPFIAPYNPTTFTVGSASELVAKYTAGGGKSPIEQKYENNKTLNVEFFFDGTGASPPLGLPIGSAFGAAVSSAISDSGANVKAINAEAAARAVASSISVTAWINYFFSIISKDGKFSPKQLVNLNAITTVNKTTHTCNPLKIMWGAGLFFNCYLENAQVTYKLFNQLGQPLRATINATFVEISGVKKNFESPDLSKVHVVIAGDTIYNLAKKEYDDESYYIKIAEANDLKNYRRLVPGQELILPPIAKVEE